MQELIGRRILALYVNEGEQMLIFETDRGDIAYVTEADCCSDTWFADIVGVPALLGHIVQDAVEIAVPEHMRDAGRTRQEEDEYYGVKLATDRGYTDIVYRNSSNGYYGGWMTLSTQEGRPDNLRQITEDWAA